MDLHEYERLAMRTAKTMNGLHMNLLHAACGVANEAGELMEPVKATVFYNKPLDHAHVKEELGDLLWFVTLGAVSMGLTLNDIAVDNIVKLQKRYPEKYTDAAAVARADKQQGA